MWGNENSWLQCWEVTKPNSIHWSDNWVYSGNWILNRSCFFEHSKFNGNYRSWHWGTII